MTIWPSVADERGVALKKLGLPADTGSWKRYRLHVQIAFFILTLIGISAFSVLSFVNRTAGSLINAVIVIVLAEVLIAMNRFFETGVETALWLAGVVYVLLALPHSGSKEGILVVGVLVAIAGARLLNPFIGGLAAMSIVIYAAVKDATPLQCALVGVVIALVAAAAQLIEWQRQSVERLFQTIAILAPLAGVIAAEFGSGIDHEAIAAVYIIAAAIILALGIALRARALLLAGALHAAIGAYEASDLSEQPAEVKLIAAGVFVIGIAIVLSRSLRKKTTGFVTTESSLTGYDEEQPTGGGFESGGGGFGGGGASAGY
jgi:uncharacterized membrane protein YgcG